MFLVCVNMCVCVRDCNGFIYVSGVYVCVCVVKACIGLIMFVVMFLLCVWSAVCMYVCKCVCVCVCVCESLLWIDTCFWCVCVCVLWYIQVTMNNKP